MAGMALSLSIPDTSLSITEVVASQSTERCWTTLSEPVHREVLDHLNLCHSTGVSCDRVTRGLHERMMTSVRLRLGIQTTHPVKQAVTGQTPFCYRLRVVGGEKVYHLHIARVCVSSCLPCLVRPGRCLQIVGISSVCVSCPVFCVRLFIPVFTSCLPCLCPVQGRSIPRRFLVMSRSSSFCASGSAQDTHVSKSQSLAGRAISLIAYCAARRRTPQRFARRLGRSFAAAASWV